MRVLVTGGARVRRRQFRVPHAGRTAGRAGRGAGLVRLRRGQSTLGAVSDQVSVMVGDVADPLVVSQTHVEHSDVVVHFAAESHNDNSLTNPAPFVHTNLIGTYDAGGGAAPRVRLHHISTDEVYGELGWTTRARFTPQTPYNPSSPYSATKAGADLLVRAWVRSFGCGRRSRTARTTTGRTSTSRSSFPARSPTS